MGILFSKLGRLLIVKRCQVGGKLENPHVPGKWQRTSKNCDQSSSGQTDTEKQKVHNAKSGLNMWTSKLDWILYDITSGALGFKVLNG